MTVLAWTMFLIPALGVPSELMQPDTLKSAVAVIGVLIAALVFFWHLRQRTTPLQWHAVVYLPLILMAYALGSMVWSHTYLAGAEAIRWFIVSLLLWLGLNTLTRENLPTLLWGIHGGAVMASVWAGLQFWLDFSPFPQGAEPSSTFNNRNYFAEYLVCTLPFSVYLLANTRASRWLPWLAGSIALNGVALLMTGTRSALIALWVLLPAMSLALLSYRRSFAWTGWNTQSRALVAVALVVGIGGLGSIPTRNPQVLGEGVGVTALERSLVRTKSVANASEYTQGSFSIRSVTWKSTLRMVAENPWTGVGAGAWEVDIPLYQPENTTTEIDNHAHNEYLQLLGEYGILVGGLVLVIGMAFLLRAWQNLGGRETHGLTTDALRFLTLLSVLGMGITSLAGFPLHLAGGALLFALSLTIIAQADLHPSVPLTDMQSQQRYKALSTVSIVALGCAIAMAMVVTVQAARAEYKIATAMQIAGFIAQAKSQDTPEVFRARIQLANTMREGITINPHYRRLASPVADSMAVSGDLAGAVEVWESVARSRPNVSAIWSNLTEAYAALGRFEDSLRALAEVKRLKPNAMATRVLEVITLARAGQSQAAARLLNDAYDRNIYDYELVQTGFAIGRNTHNWPLAVRSLQLRNSKWPEQAADGLLQLGLVYANPEFRDAEKALASFQAALAATPDKQRADVFNQVPEPYKDQLLVFALRNH